jgi:hypothetical protein
MNQIINAVKTLLGSWDHAHDKTRTYIPIHDRGRPLFFGDDSFAEKFSGPPYWEGLVFDGKHWLASRPPFPTAMAKALLDKAGGFADGDAKQLVEIARDWQRLDAEIIRHSVSGVSQAFYMQNDGIREELAAGHTIEPHRVLDREAAYQRGCVVRQEARVLQAELSVQVFAIMEPFCQRLRKVARAMVKELDAQERKTQGDFGFDFTPSGKLTSLIWFALDGWQQPIGNYIPNPSYPSLSPAPDWFGLKLFDLPQFDPNELKLNNEKLIEAAMVAHRQVIEIERQRGEEKVSTDHAAHDAELEKINKFNAELVTWGEQFQREHARPVPTVRVIHENTQPNK